MESSESPSLLSHQAPPIPPQKSPFFNFLRCFFPLSLISFGGPQAHIALFHTTFVDPPDPTPDVPILPEQTFLELYALAQSLPGPGSTQVAASLGATFGGSIGALLTFLVWHLPGFALMTAAGLWFHAHLHTDSAPLIAAITDHAIGLIAAAFAFVLLAAFKIISKTCNTKLKMSITLVSLFLAVTAPPAATSWLFVVLLALGGISHYLIVQYYTVSESENPESEVVDEEKLAASDDFSDDSNHIPDWNCHISTTTGTLLLFTCFAFSIFTALLSSKDSGAHLLKTFWRIGLTVFGGGIVVVPMLLNEFVESGLLPTPVFLAGFGLFGCIPGPMFNLAPFLGAAVLSWRGAFYGSLGIFGPGLLLQIGLLPFWERARRIESAQIFLQGTNSAAAGLIVAGVWMLLKKAFVGPTAFALTCSAGASALVYGLPPAKNIALHGAAGFLLATLGIGGPFHVASLRT